MDYEKYCKEKRQKELEELKKDRERGKLEHLQLKKDTEIKRRENYRKIQKDSQKRRQLIFQRERPKHIARITNSVNIEDRMDDFNLKRKVAEKNYQKQKEKLERERNNAAVGDSQRILAQKQYYRKRALEKKPSNGEWEYGKPDPLYVQLKMKREREAFDELVKTTLQEAIRENAGEKISPLDFNSRNIPSKVRREVWRRDQGKCQNCGSRKNLEYDHIIPFSEGGSNTARNIELLCEECNRKKSNNIG
jgi:5-methylcytosine-specific restriction endonuclease McrA